MTHDPMQTQFGSYVADDKTFCVYLAKDEPIIRRHAEVKTPSPRGDLETLLNSPKGNTGTKPQGARAPFGTVRVKSTTPKGPSGPSLRAGGKR